jgi:hypothetical protein
MKTLNVFFHFFLQKYQCMEGGGRRGGMPGVMQVTAPTSGHPAIPPVLLKIKNIQLATYK